MQNFWQNIWFNLTHITFKGRTSRKEYQKWFLFGLLISLLYWLLLSLPAKFIQPQLENISVLGKITATIYFLGGSIVAIIFSIWKAFADITIIVRRFHDFGKNAWYPLILFWIITILISILVSVIAVLVTGSALHMGKSSSVTISTLIGQFVIFIGFLYFLYLCLIKKGDEGENKYGLPTDFQQK